MVAWMSGSRQRGGAVSVWAGRGGEENRGQSRKPTKEVANLPTHQYPALDVHGLLLCPSATADLIIEVLEVDPCGLIAGEQDDAVDLRAIGGGGSGGGSSSSGSTSLCTGGSGGIVIGRGCLCCCRGCCCLLLSCCDPECGPLAIPSALYPCSERVGIDVLVEGVNVRGRGWGRG